MEPNPTSAPLSAAQLLASARPVAGTYDEVHFPDGTIRPTWQKFVSNFGGLTLSDLSSRQEMASRLLREHGATYTIYDDQQSTTNRNWKLDILPLIIGAEEWRGLESALKQRSRLLRLIVSDLYNDRRLLKEGWIPPAVLFANPGFLRAAHGVQRNGAIFHHAVDLGRGPDGRWMVLADRTQAPSGLGYSVENRVVLTSLFAEEFKDLQVQRLATFFQIEKDNLRALAPQNKNDPRVVLLTPGPLNETYFEHAYKARYLGFPLVEGGDLTVRDRKVFLKTLEGLRQVDVILRRVDDTFCDPLELRGDTWLGVTGLTEAWRAGNVAIANGLGSGVVETTALLPFLPGLCKHLLAESLILPNAVTWWCGQPRELAQVEANLSQYVIKRAFLSGAGEPVFGANLTKPQREALIAKMRASPCDYAAQQTLSLSSAPVFAGDKLDHRPLVMRCYIIPNGDDLAVLPGGLTRVSPSSKGLVVSMQSGGISKDTWILSDRPVEQMTLFMPTPSSVRPERIAGEVPSRVADQFFWLGRYAERLESLVRVLRALLQRLAGEGNEDQARELAALVPWLVAQGRLPDRFGERVSTVELRVEIAGLIESPKKQGTVREMLNRFHYNAFSLRDRLSDDTWRLCNQLQNDSNTHHRFTISSAMELLNSIVLDLAAFAGMEMENMTRGHGWRFLDMGRRLERTSCLITQIKAIVHTTPRNDAILGPLLEICDSSMTYRRRYHASPQLAAVLDLLMVDETNPRSLMWGLQQLSRHVSQLPRDGLEGSAGDEKRQVDSMLSDIASTHFTALAQAEDRKPGNLAKLCDQLTASLSSLSDTISQHYFSHVLPRVR